ncbi:hypothetical protein J7S33_19175, partial [Saccharothrix algeriensis]
MGVDRIGHQLGANFESFLGDGRTFQVRVGNRWYDATVQARLGQVTAPGVASPAKVDSRVDSGATASTTTNLSTDNELAFGGTVSQGGGAYLTVGVKGRTSTPATSANSTSSAADDREVRGGNASTGYDVPVSYTLTLTDPRTGTTTSHEVPADPGDPHTASLQVPDDLSRLTHTDNALGRKTDLREAGAAVEFLVPEAVSDVDGDALFRAVAAGLHPSVVKPGADGRTDLRDFLSPTSIRDNLHVLLNGWVTSPLLASPNASYGATVQMRAKLVDAELVGVHGSAQFRLHDTATANTGVTSSTGKGVEVGGAVGGGVGTPGPMVVTGGVTGSVSRKTTDSSSAGVTTVNRAGVQVGGNTGLYRVGVEVEVRTPFAPPAKADGAVAPGDRPTTVKQEVVAYVRLGLPEAAAHGLPVPPGTQQDVVRPGTGGTRVEPPYLSAGLAAGNVRVGRLANADRVRAQVEDALRDLPGFAGFLPTWGAAGHPISSGRNHADAAEQADNQRRLDAELSPTALRAKLDSLLGPGVQVQLKRRGLVHNDFVNVTVKATLAGPTHLGEADNRQVRSLSSAAPKLDSATTTAKGSSLGLEVRGGPNLKKPGGAILTPTASAGVKKSWTSSVKTAAGPTVNDVALNVGDAKAQVFAHDIRFEIEVTRFSRPRTWVQRVLPGAPQLQVPDAKTVVRTGSPAAGGAAAPGTDPKAVRTVEPITGEVHLWVPDGSTLPVGTTGFEPEAPVSVDVPPTTIDSLLKKTAPAVPGAAPAVVGPDAAAPRFPISSRPDSYDWLHVEAVAHSSALRDRAIEVLTRAAGRDSSLTVPGTVSRNRIDQLFSPEGLKANLRRMHENGLVEDGLRFDRRVTDRTGAVGVAVRFDRAELVSLSDTTPTEVWTGGGFKAGGSDAEGTSVEFTAAAGLSGKPDGNTPRGAGSFTANAKVTPWSESSAKATEIGGNVDRKLVRPAGERTALVRLDATFTVVGETRSGNAVVPGTPRAEAAGVRLEGGVFVRVSEQMARDMGLLQDVGVAPAPAPDRMLPPKRLTPDQPSSLGLSLVEDVPDLSAVVTDLVGKVNADTKGRVGPGLVPGSVLKDSMRNLRRLVDLTSPTSVKALIDSALDGGVPLLLHQPGALMGKDTYQVTLKAKAGSPEFLGAVNDGHDIEHILTGSAKSTESSTKGWSVGAGAKALGLHLPDVKDGGSPSVGGSAGAALGHGRSRTTTGASVEQFGHKHTATGPAVRYRVPIGFELVVEKGTRKVAEASSADKSPMTVRLHADNVRVETGTDADARQPYREPTPVPRPDAG